MSVLSQRFVFAAIEEEKNGNQFPIDFDDVWAVAGYTRKDNAKRALLDSGFEFCIDFNILKTEEAQKQGKRTVKVMVEKIYLTLDCFKAFCMMARTEEGRKTRHYFIEVEKQYRKQLENLFIQEASDRNELVTALNNAESELLTLQQNPYNPQLDPTRFDYCFDAAIQITGHRNKYNTMKRLLTYLNEGKDYKWDGAILWLSNPIFYSFVAASRTVKGIDVDKIGQKVTLDWDYYCRVNKALRTPKNSLFPISRFASNNQLVLNLGV